MGTSLIPNKGSQTQKIPPITSVRESKVNSAAGIDLDPIEYKIKPKHTIVPCVANKLPFLLEERKLVSVFKIMIVDTMAHKKPAKATVVNFGVSFLHLNETEKTENPTAETIPNDNPNKELLFKSPNAIITMPIAATIIATQTFNVIFSFKNKKPNNAVMNGMEAKQRSVIAALVCVIDHMNVIIAQPKPVPPTIPENPILK